MILLKLPKTTFEIGRPYNFFILVCFWSIVFAVVVILIFDLVTDFFDNRNSKQ